MLCNTKTQRDEHVSCVIHPSRSYKRSLGRFSMTGGIMATLDGPTTSTHPPKPDIFYQPTTQSTSNCYISPQNTPCTDDRTPTSHQERSPIKVYRLPRQRREAFPIPLSSLRQHYIQTNLLPAQPYIHNTYGSTYNMSAMNRRDKIVRRVWTTKCKKKK